MPSGQPDSESNREPSVFRRRARRCRLTAVIVLLLGLGSAGALYWLESPPPDYSDDPGMVGFSRTAQRQMSMLYGKQGQLIEDLNDSLKQPGTQAILIILAAALVAAVCFHLARVMEDNAKAEAEATPASAEARPANDAAHHPPPG